MQKEGRNKGISPFFRTLVRLGAQFFNPHFSTSPPPPTPQMVVMGPETPTSHPPHQSLSWAIGGFPASLWIKAAPHPRRQPASPLECGLRL